MRVIEPHDLELFAINSGEFYERHKQLASENHFVWQRHVLTRIIPHYCREVEPVEASPRTVAKVTMALKAYYERHVKETQ